MRWTSHLFYLILNRPRRTVCEFTAATLSPSPELRSSDMIDTARPSDTMADPEAHMFVHTGVAPDFCSPSLPLVHWKFGKAQKWHHQQKEIKRVKENEQERVNTVRCSVIVMQPSTPPPETGQPSFLHSPAACLPAAVQSYEVVMSLVVMYLTPTLTSRSLKETSQ